MDTRNVSPSYYRFFSYFFPLALQVSLQSLTYPLVAIIAARGPGGALNTAGLVQCSALIGLLWALGTGLTTGGMVYARTREGYQRFTEVNRWIVAGVAGVYLFLLIPSVSRFIFNTMLGLPPGIATPARQALLFSLPMTIMFFLRTPYMVLMYVRGATYLAFFSAVLRVLLTVLITVLFYHLKAAGVFWAVFCLTLSIGAETVFLRFFARRNVKHLPTCEYFPPRGEILGFAMTLSVGSALLSFSGFMIGAFIARAPAPEQMLPVYYLVFTATSALSCGVIRIQALTIAFFGRSPAGNRRLLVFTLVAGMIMGTLHLVLLYPGLLTWYYSGLQGLKAEDLPLVKITSLAMILFAPAVALRSYAEGIAAYHKKPMVVLTGQAIYLAMVAVVAFMSLNVGVAGNVIGPLALFVANTLGAGMIFMAMRWEQRSGIPVPETITSQNLR